MLQPTTNFVMKISFKDYISPFGVSKVSDSSLFVFIKGTVTQIKAKSYYMKIRSTCCKTFFIKVKWI